MASTIPTVLDALVTRWRLALPGIEVIDGEPIKTPEKDTVCVGCTVQPGSGAPVVQNTLDREQMSATPDRESYDITCVSASWGGDSDTKPVRDRAFDLLDAVSVDLARDQTLGELVLQARMSTQSFTQEQTTKGPVAAIQFVVHVEAYTR
jgi:hypothetical protein